jgi:hypothetical protein
MGFSISILVGSSAENSTVQVSGDEWHVITDTEKATFGLTSEAIVASLTKDGAQGVTAGYSTEPTPGHLFDCSLWKPGQCPPQTQVHLTAVSGRIVGFSSKPEIVATKHFQNDSEATGTFSGGVQDDVTNTVTNSWSQANKITATATVGFNIGVVSGSASLSFEHDWNWGGSESKATHVGTSDNVSVVLAPHQAVDAELQCSRGQLTAEVTYVANLGGDVVGAIGSGGISQYASAIAPQTVTITQTIVVDIFTSETVRLVDPATKKVLAHYAKSPLEAIDLSARVAEAT